MKRLLTFFAALITAQALYAYTITHNDYSSGGTITAAAQNTNENAVVTVINGNLDTTNIAANGVGTSQIAANAVTTAKINPGAVTGGSGGSIASATIGSYNIVNSTISNAQIVSQTIRGTTANSGGSAQEISQGSISTPDLRANAVTLLVSSTAITATSDQTTVLAQKAITTIGQPVLILAYANWACGGASCISFTHVTRGGTSVPGALARSGTASASTDFQTVILAVDTPAAGTYTYKLSGTTAANLTLNGEATLIVIELRS